MDESAVAALCAVPPDLQGGDAERFFDLIIALYGEGLTSLDDLVTQVGQRDAGLGNPATQFGDNLRMQGLDARWPDIAQMLVSEGGSGAGVAALRDQAAAAAANGADGGAGPDWGSFCVQNTDFWAGWNGSDWGTWRAAFAGLVPGELTAESERHLGYLDGLAPASQLAYLRDNLGFAINEQALAYYQSAAPAAEASPVEAQTSSAEAAAPQEQEAQLESTVLPDIAQKLSEVIPEGALSGQGAEDAFLDQLAGLFAEENAAAEADGG
jgi:hypothetical protein